MTPQQENQIRVWLHRVRINYLRYPEGVMPVSNEFICAGIGNLLLELDSQRSFVSMYEETIRELDEEIAQLKKQVDFKEKAIDGFFKQVQDLEEEIKQLKNENATRI